MDGRKRRRRRRRRTRDGGRGPGRASARDSRATTSSAATEHVRWCASRSAFRAAARTSTSAWSWRSSARASCTSALERFPPRTTYRVLHPRLRGVLAVLRAGRRRRGRGSSTRRSAGTRPWRTSTSTPIERAAGSPLPCEFEHVGFWDLRIDVAEQLPPWPGVHRRRCRAQPSSLRRLRPQHRARGRGEPRLEARRRAEGWGGTRCSIATARSASPIFDETGED